MEIILENKTFYTGYSGCFSPFFVWGHLAVMFSLEWWKRIPLLEVQHKGAAFQHNEVKSCWQSRKCNDSGDPRSVRRILILLLRTIQVVRWLSVKATRTPHHMIVACLGVRGGLEEGGSGPDLGEGVLSWRHVHEFIRPLVSTVRSKNTIQAVHQIGCETLVQKNIIE